MGIGRKKEEDLDLSDASPEVMAVVIEFDRLNRRISSLEAELAKAKELVEKGNYAIHENCELRQTIESLYDCHELLNTNLDAARTDNARLREALKRLEEK